MLLLFSLNHTLSLALTHLSRHNWQQTIEQGDGHRLANGQQVTIDLTCRRQEDGTEAYDLEGAVGRLGEEDFPPGWCVGGYHPHHGHPPHPPPSCAGVDIALSLSQGKGSLFKLR